MGTPLLDMGLLAFGAKTIATATLNASFLVVLAFTGHTVHYGDFATESRAKADETARNHLRDGYIYLCFSACHP